MSFKIDFILYVNIALTLLHCVNILAPPRMFEIAFKMFDLNGDGDVEYDEFEKVSLHTSLWRHVLHYYECRKVSFL